MDLDALRRFGTERVLIESLNYVRSDYLGSQENLDKNVADRLQVKLTGCKL